MKAIRNLTVAAVLCLMPQALSAQFFLGGDDPASARWYSIESPNYRIIYPAGLDSTARSYALELEKYRLPVSRSVNYIPGEMTGTRMPVVLHPYSALSNGSVAWAPKRMDFYTTPSAYAPEPLPWTTMLAIHESRHVAQMQFGLSHCFRPFYYIFGEMFNGALAGIYPDKWLLEGDAVVAETALSRSGRGRVSDFLNYYRIAFDDGDFRNADRWAYGSYWHYTPDHYAFGYMTLSGIRYLYDVPDFSGQLFRHYAARPYDIVARNTVSKRLTGKKFRTLVSESMDLYHDIWTEDMERRAPFLEYTRVSEPARVFTEYEENLFVDGELYSLKESFHHGRRLVKIESDGKETTVSAFGSEVGMLYWSEALGKIFWSETVPDVRWSLKYDSKIRFLDVRTGKKGTLTGKGRLFNPNPSPTDGHIAVTEYSDDGRSHLCILNGSTGTREVSFSLPDSLQLIETAWLNDTIYGTALSDHGIGIYHIEIGHLNAHDGESEIHHEEECPYHHEGMEYEWKQTLAPSPVKFFNFGTEGRYLIFTSDRTGTDEVYTMDPHTGQTWQETSSRYGVSDYTFTDDGKYFICSAADRTGSPVVMIAADSLMHRETDFHDCYGYPVADALSRQEARISAGQELSKAGSSAANVSVPEKYRKFPHLFNLHSWAPVYFDYDNIMDGSYEEYWSYASLGASAFFQNHLGTFTGFAGYSAHKDPVDRDFWRHAGHLKLAYSGLYPVIEARFDINDRAARTLQGYLETDIASGLMYEKYEYMYRKGPLVSGSLSVYIPFNLSSGGWSRGLIPRISYSVSNDRFNSWKYLVLAAPGPAGEAGYGQVTGITSGRSAIYQALSASVRYYMMRPAAHADVYPEWGIGVETGISLHPGLNDMISPSAYFHLYGYTPGIYGNQGLMLSATVSRRTGSAAPFSSGVNTLPRGLSSDAFLSQWAAAQKGGAKLSASYAMPFPLGDFHIGNLFYVTRGIITPHFDWSFIGSGQLFSAGATLEMEFGNFFGLAFPARLGVTYSYNGGPTFSSLKNAGIDPGRHTVGPVFSMDF